MEKGREKTLTVLSLFSILFFSLIVQTAEGVDCSGQTVGTATPGNYKDEMDTGSGFAYLMSGPNLQVQCCGVMVREIGFAGADGDIKAHVWRIVGGAYKLVGENDITGLAVNTAFSHGLGDSEQISVRPGDMLGWSSAGDVIAYKTEAAPNSEIQSQVTTPTLGGTTVWSGGAYTPNRRYAFGAVVEESTAPTFTNLPKTVPDIGVSQTVGSTVYTLTADDKNSDDVPDLTMSLVGTPDYFDLNPATGDVFVKKQLVEGTYMLQFKVKDGCEKSKTDTLTIIVIDDIPVITSLPVSSDVFLDEETDEETQLHTLVYTDDQPLDKVTCRMTVAPPTTAIVLKRILDKSDYGIFYTPTETLDFDKANLYSCNVTCNDGTSDSETKIFEVSINKNDDPVYTSDAQFDVSAKDTDKDDWVHDVTVTDTDGGEHEFLMDCDCPFRMTPSGKIYATENLNAHRNTPYIATVNVTDGYNVVSRTTTINVVDLNLPPVLIKPSVDNETTAVEKIDENLGANSVFYKLEASDPDDDPCTFEVEWENGVGDDVFFVDPTTGEIKTKIDLDYEDIVERYGTNRFYVQVTADDGREKSQTKRIEIVVNDVNEPPEYNQFKYSIEADEGSAYKVLDCAFFDVDDPDKSDFQKYSIDCGANGIYHVDGSDAGCSARIKMSAEDDLDNPGAESKTVTCTVTVCDKGPLCDNKATLEILVAAIDDNPPQFPKTQYDFTTNNATGPFTTIGNVGNIIDKDFVLDHKRHTFDTSNSKFGIDEDGNIYPNFDLSTVVPPETFYFDVSVKDDADHLATAPVAVHVVPAPTTTTTTTTTTQYPPVYTALLGFFDDLGNVIWFIAAMILTALLLGLLSYMLYRCMTTPGACSGWRCMGGGRHRRVAANNYPRNAPAKARPQPKPQQRPQQPTRRSNLCDCFKRNPRAHDPANPDGGRPWEPWKDADFKSKQWVG